MKDSMSRKLRVAVAQMVGRLKSPVENMTLACALSKKAASKGASLVLFPEGCLNGNAFSREKQDFLNADPREFSVLQEIADRSNMTVCIGFTAPLKDKFNNAFAIIRPEKELLFQFKCARSDGEPEFLAVYGDEKRIVFEVDGVRTVISICSELGCERIEKSIREAAPELLLHPSAGRLMEEQVASVDSDEQKTEAFKKECLSVILRTVEDVKCRAMPKICANPIGFDGETFWPGNSFAIDASGKIVLWMEGENNPDRMEAKVEVKNIRI